MRLLLFSSPVTSGQTVGIFKDSDDMMYDDRLSLSLINESIVKFGLIDSVDRFIVDALLLNNMLDDIK